MNGFFVACFERIASTVSVLGDEEDCDASVQVAGELVVPGSENAKKRKKKNKSKKDNKKKKKLAAETSNTTQK
jgi:hypothetical protein